MVYRVQFAAGQWFIRTGAMLTPLTPTGEGYTRRRDAVRGAERRRRREQRPKAPIRIYSRTHALVSTR